MSSRVESLREQWNHLSRDNLPALANRKDPVQPLWPVHLDHCFARIVLDNAIGQNRPWTEVVRPPAVKNMTERQLESAIGLAERIVAGKANLDELNHRSLELRGKKKRKGDHDASPTTSVRGKKVKRTDGDVSSYFTPSSQSPSRSSNTAKGNANGTDTQIVKPEEGTNTNEDVAMEAQIRRIQESKLTSFRKQALILLCQIPRGRYSTYQALSDYITRSSHKTCARAVGNAMRNNPFAPEVPCHRVLANDGSLGGFCGSWGEKGKFAGKKHELLHEEGVRFDSRGKVTGPPFRNFTA